MEIAGLCCFHPSTHLPEHLLVLLLIQLCKRFWAGIMKGIHTTQLQKPNLAHSPPYTPFTVKGERWAPPEGNSERLSLSADCGGTLAS